MVLKLGQLSLFHILNNAITYTQTHTFYPMSAFQCKPNLETKDPPPQTKTGVIIKLLSQNLTSNCVSFIPLFIFKRTRDGQIWCAFLNCISELDSRFLLSDHCLSCISSSCSSKLLFAAHYTQTCQKRHSKTEFLTHKQAITNLSITSRYSLQV